MVSERDRILLEHLRHDSRKSLAKISKETGIPLSTLFEALKKLENSVIRKHVTLLDFSKAGYSLKTGFAISASDKWGLKEYLASHPNVNTLSTLINNHDFYAECVFRDMRQMIDFKDKLKDFGIKDIEEICIIDEIKRESFEL